MSYQEFIKKKLKIHEPSGFDVSESDINPMCLDWQKELIRLSLKRGRSALFEDCGLGKTLQELEWSRIVSDHTGMPVMNFAPLAVSKQTVREGEKFGIPINYCADSTDVKIGINITNYERCHKFDFSSFGGVVLDESSIIKHFDGKFRKLLIEQSVDVPFKLAASATPSPNDETELGNTAEFLGVCSRADMLSDYFINDTGDTGKWRLKGHAAGNRFWEFLASWAVAIRKPSDIGYDDNGFVLPPLNMMEHVIPYTGPRDTLFVEPERTLNEIRKSMKQSMPERVAMCAEIVNESSEIWVAWCNTNAESEALTAAINGAVEVKGPDSMVQKEKSFMDFLDGNIKCLVTKPKIAMFGMNWQHCHNTVVTGLSHSYEQFYQLIRRFWRFLQPNEVNAHIVIGEREGNVLAAIREKEIKMNNMYDSMVKHMAGLTMEQIGKTTRKFSEYNPQKNMNLPEFIRRAA